MRWSVGGYHNEMPHCGWEYETRLTWRTVEIQYCRSLKQAMMT
jgi:hypothetical protein